MADPSPGSDRDPAESSGHPGADARSGPPATPRWVKVAGIVVLVVAVLVVVMVLLGHGPGQHTAAAMGQSGAGVSR